MRSRFRTSLRLLLVAGLVVSTEASAAESDRTDPLPGPGRLLPDVGPTSPGIVDVLPDGTRRLIVNGMRILDYADGSVERAREILTAGTARTPVVLPARMGGGVLFAVWAGEATQLWRAKSWMGELEPLASIGGKVGEMVPGFDRIYLSVSGGLKAIDPLSGRPKSIDPLPSGTTIGPFAFADAWRAVAVVDYRGPLTTFDAGNSWRPIPLDTSVLQVSVREGSFVLDVPGRRFALGSSGEIVLDESPTGPAIPGLRDRPPGTTSSTGSPSPETLGNARRGTTLPDRRALGRRPLRAAIESGWPTRGPGGEATAVFAQSGSLYRVALQRIDADHPTGAILEVRPGAFRSEDEDCSAVPLGRGFGFVCNSPLAGSSIYAFEQPFAMREIARFDAEGPGGAGPRYRKILSSGNGGLVVVGSCARNEYGLAGASTFCFFSPSGEQREVTPPALTKGERDALRPVALSDGRALFLVPPSDRSGGRLLISRGDGFVTVPIPLWERDSWLKRAMIEDGVEEREPGVLGAWAIVGNDLRGVRIGTDGKVVLGLGVVSSQRTVVSGRYAFDWGTTSRGRETTDGGMSWSVVDLATSPLDGSTRASAACGPVGASEGATRDGKPGSWLRVGWGSAPEDPDLVMAKEPQFSHLKLADARGVSMRCEPTGEISGPAPKPPTPQKSASPAKRPPSSKITPAPPVPTPPPLMPPRILPPIFPGISRPPPVASPPPVAETKWSAFRGAPPPSLRRDDKGLEAGAEGSPQAHIYVWGTKGADWIRSGHVQVRFDDPFDLVGIRSTALAPALWSDEDKAADALGLTPNQLVGWSMILDVSGQAAVLVGRRAGRTDLYAAVQGEPLVAWRDIAGGALPAPLSAVRVEGTWFFLAQAPGSGAGATIIYRVDGGVVRRVARLPRVAGQNEPLPRLAKRAQSRGLGIIVRGMLGFDQRVRDWYVLGVNEETGDLDAPVRLFGSDLEGQIPPRCAPDEDGWLVATGDFELSPAVQMVAPLAVTHDSVEARLRLDPGKACVDALASRSEGLVSPVSAGHRVPPVFDPEAALPLATTDRSSGRRWLLRCGR